MKQILNFLFLSVFCLTLAACSEQNVVPDDNHHEEYVPVGGSGPIRLRASLLPQVNRDNAFALDLFRQLCTTSPDANVVVSPLSVSLALGMAKNGAAGQTLTEMSDMMGFKDMPDSLVNGYYEVMQKTLPVVDSSTTVHIANSLWYTTDFVVKNAFLQVNRDYFGAEVRKIDFRQPWAKDTINAWVDEKTGHLIPSIVESTANQVMFLINAVYFKGAWVIPFDPDNTHTVSFTNEAGKQVSVKQMSLLDTLRYGEDAKAQYLDLA